MPTEPWSTALGQPSPEPAAALAALPPLIGPVHRLAWSGEDEAGDRRRALAMLQRLTEALVGAHPALAAVLDWWMVTALGERAYANAWDIDRELKGATGDTLREILGQRGDRPLLLIRRPARFATILDRLEELAVKHLAKIAPAIRILKEAGAECNTLIVAARNGAAPPEGLRLAGLTQNALESWAAEAQGGRRVDPGTPVWEHVTRSLRERADLVDEALSIWPTGPAPDLALPATWEADLESACAPHQAVAIALVADALPEPGERPALRPDPAWYQVPPPDSTRWAVFALAREAYAEADTSPPRWFKDAAAELDQVEAEIHRLRATARGGHAEYLDEAEKALRAMELPQARDWLTTARDELGRATQDASFERRRSLLQERATELAAMGIPIPVLPPDLDTAEAELNQLAARTRADLTRRIEDTARTLSLLLRPGPDPAELTVAAAHLARGLLGLAYTTLTRVETAAREARAADDTRLGPDLASLRDRLAPRPDRAAFLEVLDLAATRREHGLDPTPVIRDLEAVLTQPHPAAIGVPDPNGMRRIALVPAPVRATGVDTRSAVPVGSTRVCGEAAAVARVRRWGEAGKEPSYTYEQERFFLVASGSVKGPFRAEGDAFVAEHGWCASGALPEPIFRSLFGAVDLPDGHWLVPYPPSLEELITVGATIADELDEEPLAAWIAGEVEGAPPAADIARWMREQAADTLPPTIRDARFSRFSWLIGRAEALEEVKASAVATFLAGPDGEVAVAAAATMVAAADEARIRALHAAREAHLAAEIDALETRRAGLAATVEAEERELRDRLAETRQAVEDADAALADRRLAIVARFSAAAEAPKSAAAPIRAARMESPPLPPLDELVRMVADGTWREDDVTNLLVSVLTGRWTLLAGLPGVGKSTFVRSVLSRLGHGPGSGRYLELVVRRDWQDDTPLFGFWHPTHHAWESSSEGFLEHLLRAVDDRANGYGGVYPVLIEELNLASPEYYLTRPISALEAGDPTVRLYDAELVPRNAARYPAAFSIPDSVRLLGTVNVDDTVERLSPRFLSRTSVIWVEANPDGTAWRPEDDAARITTRWDTLTAAIAGPPAALGDLTRLFRFLTERRAPGAPTERTRVAIARYLGAAQGLIERRHAEDLQVLQRVLPPLRGVGPRWRTLLDDLVVLLERHGWVLSAARARELRARGEELGDWYDFFHT